MDIFKRNICTQLRKRVIEVIELTPHTTKGANEMTRTIELPKNNKFIIDNNDVTTIIGNEAHTIYFEAQKELRTVKKELKLQGISLTNEENQKMEIEFIEAIIRRELK
jgi:hypothetical protein